MKRNYEYLLSDLSLLKGVGTKTSNLLKKKKVNTIFDLLWKLPKSYTDRSLSSKIKDFGNFHNRSKIVFIFFFLSKFVVLTPTPLIELRSDNKYL